MIAARSDFRPQQFFGILADDFISFTDSAFAACTTFLAYPDCTQILQIDAFGLEPAHSQFEQHSVFLHIGLDSLPIGRRQILERFKSEITGFLMNDIFASRFAYRDVALKG